MDRTVAVIGGGSSGLAAIKCCLDEGLRVVCFERYSDIGGIWNYREEPEEGRASVYKSCVINTSKEMMAYSDFPMPTEFPPFMPHHKLLEYLRQYAEHFNLTKHIRFNTSVNEIKQAPDYITSGRWIVKTQSTDGVREETFEAVMVCTGHHSVPHMPSFPGADSFKGRSFHSQEYRTPDCFRNKNVLVVGIGNSAVDIAVDASSQASQVFVSTRRGAWVVGRRGFWGLPNDMLANNRALFYSGKTAMQWMVEKMANFRCDHEVYGLKPSHRGLEAHPTITDDLPNQIIRGRVLIKGDISSFTESGVIFEDGSCENIDIVVYATGYQYECPFLDSSVLKIENNKTCLYKHMFPPALPHPTLSIIALVQAVGAVMPLAEIQSRWSARLFTGKSCLPSREEMLADIEGKARNIQSQYLNTQRHALETMWVPYMDEIAEQFGARPNLWQIAKCDPPFALRCFFGPCVPAQYRLQGPHPWDGAKDTVQNAFKNCKIPLTTRKLSTPTVTVSNNKNPINIFSTNFTSRPRSSLFRILFTLLFCLILISCLCK